MKIGAQRTEISDTTCVKNNNGKKTLFVLNVKEFSSYGNLLHNIVSSAWKSSSYENFSHNIDFFLETGNLSHAPVKIVETEVYYAIESSRDRKTVSYATESSETIVSYAIESSRDRKTVSYAIESSRDRSLLRH